MDDGTRAAGTWDWYGMLKRTPQRYPELVTDFDSHQGYECCLS